MRFLVNAATEKCGYNTNSEELFSDKQTAKTNLRRTKNGRYALMEFKIGTNKIEKIRWPFLGIERLIRSIAEYSLKG
ncbi:MAG: hypothetical protein KIC77_06415 [Clostridiales bacterium]|nr:hypothetical protein [Clostridiales bacterium]